MNQYQHVTQTNNLILAKGQTAGQPVQVRWHVNTYDPTRAHFAVFHGDGQPTVRIPAHPFLTEGQSCTLKSPADFYGPPQAQAVCKGGSIEVPVPGEFGVLSC